jgi:hypothetical protein
MDDDGTERIDFADGSPCLGSYVHASLRDDHEIRVRVREAAQMHGCLRRCLLSSKDTCKEVKKKVLVGMMLPTLLGGAEQGTMKELKSAHHKMTRGCSRMTTHATRKQQD